MARPDPDGPYMDQLRYYKDRVETLEARLHHMDQLLSEVSFHDYPQAKELLTPKNFERINNIVETMIHTRKKQEIYDLIIQGIRDIFGFERLSILEIRDGVLHVASNHGLPEDYVNNLKIPVEEREGKDHRSALARCAARGEPVVVEDRSNCLDYNRREQAEGKTYSHQFLGIPIVTFGQVVGVLTVAVERNSRHYLNEQMVDILTFFVNQCAATLENQRLHACREVDYQNMIRSLAEAVEVKDATTGNHARRLQKLSELFGQKLSLSENEIDELKWGAILHDIGKIGVDNKILRKAGSLTNKEFEEIKKHPRRGFEILEPLDFINGAKDIVLHHHEFWDGTGYPDQLKGDEIPLLARILNLIDSYDVMIHERPYKDPMPPEESVAEIISCAGTQFDPDLVDPFLETLTPETVEKGKKILNGTA